MDDQRFRKVRYVQNISQNVVKLRCIRRQVPKRNKKYPLHARRAPDDKIQSKIRLLWTKETRESAEKRQKCRRYPRNGLDDKSLPTKNWKTAKHYLKLR